MTRGLRLTVTKAMGLLMMDYGIDQKLGVDPSRSMLLQQSDLEYILSVVPRRGKTGMALRRRCAALKARCWVDGQPEAMGAVGK